MTVIQALLAFTVAAGLLTLTPGLDTALVLRTAAVEGPRRAVLAVVGRREAKDGTVALRIGEGAQAAVPAGDLASRIAAVASADVGVVSVREVA